MSTSVDLSGVYRRIEDVRAEVRQAAYNLSNQLSEQHHETMSRLNYLKDMLDEMERQAKLRDAFQRATTEVIRVRQELENKFGAHKLVREYMLGILDATESGLVTKETVSKCSEELMLSAPKYWLAPALIALAGWISDNKTLATRAVAEAQRRDIEKTALLFALITRRVNAGRIAAGRPGSSATFEWLNLYFSKQEARNMKQSVVTYLTAYSNGIFGYDADDLCKDQINKWMKDLMRENPNFEEEQKNHWVGIFKTKCQDLAGEKYNALRLLSPANYAQMNAYVSKINAAEKEDGIRNYFLDIINTPVDKKTLIDAIDKHLRLLVEQYEEGDEEQLRDEEQYLQFVKEFQGDEERAKEKMDKIRAGRVDKEVNFAARLVEAAMNPNSDVSEKKTAVYLLQNYINAAFEEFVSADKATYPAEIELTIVEGCKFELVDQKNKEAGAKPKPFKWQGKTVNGENREQLVLEVEEKYDNAKKVSLEKISDEKAKKLKKAGFICMCCVVGVVLLFGIIMFAIGNNKLKNNTTDRERITKYLDKQKAMNVKLLNNAIDARIEANKIVADFDVVKETEGAVVSM